MVEGINGVRTNLPLISLFKVGSREKVNIQKEMFYMEIPLLSYKCKLNKDMQCDFFNVRKSHTPYLSQQTLIKPTGFSFLILSQHQKELSVSLSPQACIRWQTFIAFLKIAVQDLLYTCGFKNLVISNGKQLPLPSDLMLLCSSFIQQKSAYM